jgi:hypothetical protein
MSVKVIVYVWKGLVADVFSTDPETKVILYDSDNIENGDDPPFSDHDLEELHKKATPNCAAEIKDGKFFHVF